MAADVGQKTVGIQQYYVTKIDELQVYTVDVCVLYILSFVFSYQFLKSLKISEDWKPKGMSWMQRVCPCMITIITAHYFIFVPVRLLREELQLLQEQGSHVGEVVKAMDKKKVLVKVSEENGVGVVKPHIIN